VRRHHIGLLALFVALSGTAYATATIGSSEIENNAIKSRHIEHGQVKGKDVKESSLAKVPNANLLDGKDSTAFLGQVTARLKTVDGSTLTNTNAEYNPYAECNAGEHLVGGGYVAAGGVGESGFDYNYHLRGEFPGKTFTDEFGGVEVFAVDDGQEPTAWVVDFDVDPVVESQADVKVYALCAD
jgi:hypothetical protein